MYFLDLSLLSATENDAASADVGVNAGTYNIAGREIAENDKSEGGSANTTAVTAKSAVQAVFNTTELLEQIISHLPMRQIAATQRVARNWKEVIHGSPTIQTQLWLRPATSEVLPPAHPIEGPQASCIPFQVVYHQKVKLNPLTQWVHQGIVLFPFEVTESSFPWYTDGFVVSFSGVLNRFYIYQIIAPTPPKVTMPESWLRMFLTDPPVTTIKLQAPMRESEEKRILTRRGRITLGVVKNEMDDMIRKALPLVYIPKPVRAKGRHAVEKYLCKSMGRHLPDLWVQDLIECRV